MTGNLVAFELILSWFEVREHNPQFVLGVLCIIGFPVQFIREGFSGSSSSSSSSTHICLALRRLLMLT